MVITSQRAGHHCAPWFHSAAPRRYLNTGKPQGLRGYTQLGPVFEGLLWLTYPWDGGAAGQDAGPWFGGGHVQEQRKGLCLLDLRGGACPLPIGSLAAEPARARSHRGGQGALLPPLG